MNDTSVQSNNFQEESEFKKIDQALYAKMQLGDLKKIIRDQFQHKDFPDFFCYSSNPLELFKLIGMVLLLSVDSLR